MPLFRRSAMAALLAAAAFSTSARAQGSALVTDLVKDIEGVEQKMVALAKAIPADKYGWRPATGVRSIGEVVMHVASDNYFIPSAAGTPAPASTGISPSDYKTVTAFEARKVSNDEAVKELQASFAFMKQAMKAMPAEKMGAKQNMFGQEFTGQQLWIMATTHLHEHLGQMIAYARSNGVTPPWSK